MTTASAVSMPARTILCRTSLRLFCMDFSSLLFASPACPGRHKKPLTPAFRQRKHNLLLSGLYRRSRNSTVSCNLRCSQTITAGGEFRPAPKTQFIKFVYSIALLYHPVNFAGKSIFETKNPGAVYIAAPLDISHMNYADAPSTIIPSAMVQVRSHPSATAWFVRHNHHRLPALVQLPEDPHHLLRRHAVQRARRLVRQNHVRVVHHRTRDRHSLRLSARQLVRSPVRKLPNPQFFQYRPDPLPALAQRFPLQTAAAP